MLYFVDLNDDVIELHPGHSVLELDVSKAMSVDSTSLIFSFRTNQPQVLYSLLVYLSF